MCSNEIYENTAVVQKSNIAQLEDGPSTKYKLYKKRFVMNLLLSLSLLLNGELWISFSSITPQLVVYFEKTESSINWFSTMFLLIPGICAVPSVFLPTIFGLRWCLLLGCIAHFIGTGFRLVAIFMLTLSQSLKYYMCILGCVFLAIAQGIILNLPPFLSAKWFGFKERDMSTSVTIFFSLIGISIGFIFPFCVVHSSYTDNSIQKSLQLIVSCEFSLSVLVLVLTYAFSRDRPPTPPSPSEESIGVEFQGNMGKTIISMIKKMFCLFKDIKTLLLLFAYGWYYAVPSTISTFLSEMVDYYIKSDTKLAGYMGATALILGGTATIISGIIVSKLGPESPIPLSSALNFLSGFTLIIITILNESGHNSNVAMFIIYSFYGIFNGPFLSLGFEILANYTYPNTANLSSTAAILLGNILGGIMVPTFGLFSYKYKYLFTLIFGSAMFMYNGFLLLCVKYRNKRLQFEQGLNTLA